MFRTLIAWGLFIAGVICTAVDVINLRITGLYVLGMTYLVLWAWLIGAFKREFWLSDELSK